MRGSFNSKRMTPGLPKSKHIRRNDLPISLSNSINVSLNSSRGVCRRGSTNRIGDKISTLMKSPAASHQKMNIPKPGFSLQGSSRAPPSFADSKIAKLIDQRKKMAQMHGDKLVKRKGSRNRIDSYLKSSLKRYKLDDMSNRFENKDLRFSFRHMTPQQSRSPIGSTMRNSPRNKSQHGTIEIPSHLKAKKKAKPLKKIFRKSFKKHAKFSVQPSPVRSQRDEHEEIKTAVHSIERIIKENEDRGKFKILAKSSHLKNKSLRKSRPGSMNKEFEESQPSMSLKKLAKKPIMMTQTGSRLKKIRHK